MDTSWEARQHWHAKAMANGTPTSPSAQHVSCGRQECVFSSMFYSRSMYRGMKNFTTDHSQDASRFVGHLFQLVARSGESPMPTHNSHNSFVTLWQTNAQGRSKQAKHRLTIKSSAYLTMRSTQIRPCSLSFWWAGRMVQRPLAEIHIEIWVITLSVQFAHHSEQK